MLSLFTRRVALSAHRSTATYTRILPSPASTFRARTIADTTLHPSAVWTSANPQRNASTEAAAATKKAQPSTESTTTGRAKPRRGLTPAQEATKQALLEKWKAQRLKKAAAAAALKVKQKARREREKEVAARKRKRLAEKKEKEKEKNRKVREAQAKETKKAKEKAKEAQRLKIINPPPRRMSGFMLYIQEMKRPIPEVSSNWNTLAEEEKQKYNASAKVLQGKREEEFDAFMKTVTRRDIVLYNRKQRANGKNRISTRPYKHLRYHAELPPYIKFAQEFRERSEQAGNISVLELSKAAGAVWRSMTREEKDKYKSQPTQPVAAEQNSQSL